MWESPGVLKRRVPRVLVTGFVLAVAVGGLSGCRTSPNVAAYVGQEQITVAQLDSAVDERLADKDVAAYAKAHGAAFRRQVLTTLIDQQVFAEAARRYGVTVGDGEIRSRYAELLAARNTDAATLEKSAAQSGASPRDVLEEVRHIVVVEKLATATGKGDPLTETALKQRYQQELSSFTKKDVGLIQVADQPAADAVLAQLVADPTVYPTVAAQNPGQNTLPVLQALDTTQLPAQVASQIAAAAPNTGFPVPLQGGAVVVVFVGNSVTSAYSEVRPKLVEEAAASVDKAGASLVSKVRSDMRLTVNPRYGVFKGGSVTEPTGGLVDILGSSGSASASAAPSTGGAGG
jgi:peptidyl-prolyl cis-trans isomerase SurA